MILTCPRCATRYLVDPLQVWTVGRTVQCAACGQRWRAVGDGVRTAAVQIEEPPREDAPVVEAAPGVASDVVEPLDGGEAGPSGVHEPEAVDQPPEPVAAAEPSDWHATLPVTPPTREETLTGVSMFRTPPPARRRAPQLNLGRWLAIAFLVLLALAACVVYRALIVEAFPGLAPVFGAVGLVVPASPHG